MCVFPSQLERFTAALADRYAIERPLGSGGMATVYLADDLKHDRKVAVKVLRPELATSLGAERFLREIRIAARLAHPNILPLYDSGEADGFLFYVMPFVEGKSLRERLEEEGALPLDDALRIAREVADALDYAHRSGIVHRDIKPENIMIEEGHAVVTDFGVARAVSEARQDKITQTGFLVGTPLYMSPEQAGGSSRVDGRSDIYALGCVLYEMLAGRPPFDGGVADALLESKLLQSVPGLPAVRVPPAVELAVKRALARRPDDRFATAAQFAEALAGRALEARGRRPALGTWQAALAAGVVAVAGVGLWWALRPERAAAAPATVAFAPFEVSGRVEGIELATALPKAFEAQLQYWPGEFRVVRSAASRVAQGHAFVADGREVRVELLVFDAASGQLLESGEVTGPVDSLGSLVSSLVIDVFVRPVADSLTGYRRSLPRGREAVSAWLRGEEDFRHGAYDRAIAAFDEVIARDSAFAFAYFKRMLAELLRTQPTRAFTNVRSALHAARAYRDALDPTSAAILEAYEVFIGEGDLERAQDMLEQIVERHPEAVDAWFLMAYMQYTFAPLLGAPRPNARRAAQRAYALEPELAPAIAVLGPVALIERDYPLARRYIAQYLKLDSTSAWAELARMTDSLLTLRPEVSLRILETLPDRPAAVLEMLGASLGDLHRPPPVQVVADRSVRVLWDGAVTRRDRDVAFRLLLATYLGGGRDLSADSLLRSGRLRGVSQQELDRWALLGAVTGVAALASEAEQRAAARRLLAATDDAEALWLAARWYRDREALLAGPLAGQPLASSLRDDLHAQDSLAAGDAEGAARIRQRAQRRYSIEHVIFGLTGSLWPLRLEDARRVAAAEDWESVLRVTATFEQMAGFVDQVAWSEVLPLRSRAFEARGDSARARETNAALWEVLRFANGPRAALRDSLANLPGVRSSRAPT
jgi:tRNA A-37 threonylcarbamoyl transferase component Bud32/tetratricopeptide (TPR) repeat protein